MFVEMMRREKNKMTQREMSFSGSIWQIQFAWPLGQIRCWAAVDVDATPLAIGYWPFTNDDMESPLHASMCHRLLHVNACVRSKYMASSALFLNNIYITSTTQYIFAGDSYSARVFSA